MNRERSRQVMERARQVLPGGVDSPVRAYRAVGGDPVVERITRNVLERLGR